MYAGLMASPQSLKRNTPDSQKICPRMTFHISYGNPEEVSLQTHIIFSKSKEIWHVFW